MSHRRSSTSGTSLSTTNQSQAEQLAQDLWNAIERTVENVAENDKHSRQFLPKTALNQILNYRSLQLLFEELLPGGSFPSGTNELITQYIEVTLGRPSRISLLALFLCEHREKLLSLYLEWLDAILNSNTANRDRRIPSDNSIPFTKETLDQCGVPRIYHRSIFDKQAIFKPVTLRQLKHHEINNRERLPFVGRQEPIKKGSSGDVVRATIAQSHWKIQGDKGFVPGNPKNPKVVALKNFKAVSTVRDMVEATRDFEIERDILSELRKSKVKHETILLDLGSITVLGEDKMPICHSLIFELANFSLDDYLKRQDPDWQPTRPSHLLGALVDIVEALSCLHDSLRTLHLDIKPDNILIFDNPVAPSRNGHYEFVWKLSDFGLARKKNARQKARSTQASAATSLLSAVPATRPAGLYQAPEIQEQDISQAGRGSDVWSMGCVTLMVLALMIEGPLGVIRLESELLVVFSNGGGREPLFYIRSDSYKWRNRMQSEHCYLVNRIPEEYDIPGTARPLRAALHPNLIEWFNILLLESCARQVRQQFVLKILQVIFGGVLRINSRKRMTANDLRRKLADIQEDWRMYELTPDDYPYRDIPTFSYTEETPSSLKPESPPQKRPEEDSLAAQASDLRIYGSETTPSLVITGPIATQHDAPYNLQQSQMAPTLEQRNEVLGKICKAIERDNATDVRLHLRADPDTLSQPCPGLGRYPIHWALLKNAYKALDVLLEHATPEITGIVCHERTALDLACESGKPAALECIRKHREKFIFPQEIYKKRKANFGKDARRIADDLFEIRKGSILKFFQ